MQLRHLDLSDMDWGEPGCQATLHHYCRVFFGLNDDVVGECSVIFIAHSQCRVTEARAISIALRSM